MIQILFKTVFRNFRKSPYQLGLNILGLALGFATVIYIASYIDQESGFDNFHSKADRIYRCVTHIKIGETEKFNTNSEPPMATTAQKELPEIESATRLFYRNNVVVKAGNVKDIEEKLWYADNNFFQIFDFKLLEGEKEEVFAHPYNVVLTKEFSRKYFGDENPIGKSIEIAGSGKIYRVKGILDKIPANSHLQFGMLASFSSLSAEESKSNDVRQWGNFPELYTYFLVQEQANINAINDKFNTFPLKYYNQNFDVAEFEKQGNFAKHSLQPLTEIHLDKTYIDGVFVYGNKDLLFIVGIVGIFIIVISSFNFINLSTAQAALRVKEIGVKKIIGSTRSTIVVQVLTETFLQCCIALTISLILLFVSLPVINSYVGVNMDFYHLLGGYNILCIFALLSVIVLVSGIVPSFMIAKFNPVEIVKGTAFILNSKSGLRNALVTLQFVVCIALICTTIIVRKQCHLLTSKNPGFNKENVLVAKNTNLLGNSGAILKTEMLKTPGVIDASFTSVLPSKPDDSYNPFSPGENDRKLILFSMYTDNDFLDVLKTKMIDGNFFSERINEEQNNAVINETTAKLLGWTDSKDKIIHDYNNGGKDYHIIGIVGDFNLESLKQKIVPVIIRATGQSSYLAVRIQPGSATSVLHALEKHWDKLYGKAPFEYFFLDETFDNQYKTEIRLGKLVSLFSVFSIVIACLGLLGLVSYALNRKQKEIGIRKVNGAKVSEILTLLNQDLVKWVVIAFVIATPIAYYAMNKWLENFAYKTTLSWWIFALAGLLALGIALLTVSWQSWRAATRNPVEALRYE